MFKKLLSLLRKHRHPASPAGEPGHASAPSGDAVPPYRLEELKLIYELMFCDDATLYRPAQDGAAPPSAVLFGMQAEHAVVRAIADDKDEESRVRILAYNWLRENGHAVTPRELLGVIVEVPLDEGLDVLAAYADGSVRYINQTGRFAVFEGVPGDIAARAQALVAAAAAACRQAGAAHARTAAPPVAGNIRLTYLVSDGLVAREGLFETMAQDKHAQWVIQSAQGLLELVVKQAAE